MRTSRGSAFLAAGMLAVALFVLGCNNESPTSPSGTVGALAADTKVFVFNAQLNNLFWDNPDIRPELYGHAQIKLRDNRNGTFRLEVKGTIFNPDLVQIFTGTVEYSGNRLIEFIDNPEIRPTTDFFDSDTIPSAIAAVLIDDPNILVARIEFAGGELTGTFARVFTR